MSKTVIGKVDSLLSQMNQQNGFWDVTEPMPKVDTSQLKLSQLKKVLVPATSNAKKTKNRTDLDEKHIEFHYLNTETTLNTKRHLYANYKNKLTPKHEPHLFWHYDSKKTEHISISDLNKKKVAQLHTKHLIPSSITRSIRELKDCELVTFKSGGSKKINFNLSKNELDFYNHYGDFIIEPGDFEIFVDGNSIKTIHDKSSLK